ncbi:MAG: DASS family sodium-coupled anion symporter [Bdellovibrionales bacterium]|nr:DASS family sodium-coupled anion symporter [Bdellovibrionales bacterium]
MRILPLILGPLSALACLNISWGIPVEAHRMAALMLWVIVWWLSEAIPLSATALLGAALLVAFGICDAKEAFAPFANPVIFLFLGGFLIARAMQVHGLDRRLALFVLTRKWGSGSALSAVITLFAVGAFLSMWISNTATTALMLPIALGVLASLYPESPRAQEVVLIGIAYACSLGGLGTPVGSPPNAIALGILNEQKNIDIGFLEWMEIGVPMLIAGLVVLSYFTARELRQCPSTPFGEKIHSLFKELGPTKKEEWLTLFAVGVVFVLWVGPGILGVLLGNTHPFPSWLDKNIPESVAAMLAASLLFILPGKNGQLLSWKEATQIDWGALILFGGGLSLGTQLFHTGLAAILGEFLIRNVGPAGATIFLIALTYFTIFFTEVASNTASANLLVPLALSASNAFGANASFAVLSVAFSCSLAFMMPVATPPNAIVYGTGKVDMRRMMRLGWWMNLAMGVVVLLVLRILRGPFVP